MTTKVYSTLDPTKQGLLLNLLQGNLQMTTLDVCDFSRAVFGTIAQGAGRSAYECYVWSQSQPQGGLVNLWSVGVAASTCSLALPVGHEALSWGLRQDGVYNNNVKISSDSGGNEIQGIGERKCIGFFLDQSNPSAPYAVWVLEGNAIFQCNLTPGHFYVPAFSIGSSTPADVSLQVNFGQNLFNYPNFPATVSGAATSFKVLDWSESFSDGTATLYLSIIGSGLTTSPTDSPANTQFLPEILNASDFSIRRAPLTWYEGATDNSASSAAFGQLQLNNANNKFKDLLDANLRDTPATIYVVPDVGLTVGNQFAAQAKKFATCIIDKIEPAGADVLLVNLRDSVTAFDKVLPTRFVPGFADAGVANTMKYLSFGAFRERDFQLIDTPNRIYIGHDGPITNLTFASDMGAPLDFNSNPPQLAPAINNSGVQLETMPVGKLTFEGSSYGNQAAIPGVADVLNGDGDFLGTWTGSPSVPPNWSWTHHSAGATTIELTNPPYTFLGTSNGITLRSTTAWNPDGGTFADSFVHSYALLPGHTYRVTFGLYNTIQEIPFFIGGMIGGLILATSLSTNPSEYITGKFAPITVANFAESRFAFEFVTPNDTTTRHLYFIVAPSAGNIPANAQGSCQLTLFDIKLEKVGQFVQQPLAALPFENYLTEILVDRGGYDASIFNSTEAGTVFARADTSRMPWAICFNSPPNILDCLKTPCDTAGFVYFTDVDGVIRFRQQVDPLDPANKAKVKCRFTKNNATRPVPSADLATEMTTLFGARRTQSVYQASDFVTDQSIVTQSIKTQWSRTSQFWVYSSYVPNSEYAVTINAPIFDTLFDDTSDAQTEVDRVIGSRSPKIYSDGTISNGKRQHLDLIATYDDPNAIGDGITCDVTDILYGDIVLIDFPELGYDSVYGSIVAWEPFPYGNKFGFTVLI
jgi:hypothetical protein